ncbi:heterokaryon incompatibility protein-domain-containing protein [Xylariaceae sp. FL1272]|nr:heterokaryon incompatibility protein-domain-containing protein [Xylariaceae sp. FL1272]
MAPLYEHKPLTSPSCIRVIILKPARSKEAPIECTLEEVDLQNITPSSEYEALSYVWGSPIGTLPIQCHGKELLVTPSCHDALIGLRRRWKRRRIFIDAICIDQRQNQTSRREREHSVSQMGKVYRRASRVVIWLGSLETIPHKLVRRIRLIELLYRASGRHESYKLRTLRVVADSTTWAGNPLAKMISLYVFNKNNKDSFRSAGEEILGNPWFGRVWTLQEGLLPDQERCVIMSDSGILNYSLIMSFLFRSRFLDFGSDYSQEASNRDDLLSLVSRSKTLADSSTGETNFGYNFYNLCLYMGHLSATLPQDRIYGFYGILDFLGVDLPGPDYSMNELEAFELTTLAIIKSSRSLNILQHCVRFDESARRPSWILGTATDAPTWLIDDLVFTSERYLSFEASNKEALFCQKRGSGKLALQGILIGKIDSMIVPSVMGALDTHLDQAGAPFFSYIHHCRSWCQHVAQRNTDLTGEGLATAVMRVLLHGYLEGIRDYNESTTLNTFSTCLEWLDLMLYPDCHLLDPIDIKNLSELAPKFDNAPADANGDITYSVTVAKIFWMLIMSEDKVYATPRIIAGRIVRGFHHALMILDTGHLASGLYVCKEGDVVAILAGGSTPMVLRHVEGNEYRVVAPLYVDGIMYGETWPEESSDLEEIVLI